MSDICADCILAKQALAAEREKRAEAERTLADALANPAGHKIDNCTTWRAMGELTAERDSLRALLRDVAGSGVEFDDVRVGYVEVQIDRPVWDAVQKVRQG